MYSFNSSQRFWAFLIIGLGSGMLYQSCHSGVVWIIYKIIRYLAHHDTVSLSCPHSFIFCVALFPPLNRAGSVVVAGHSYSFAAEATAVFATYCQSDWQLIFVVSHILKAEPEHSIKHRSQGQQPCVLTLKPTMHTALGCASTSPAQWSPQQETHNPKQQEQGIT